METHPVGSELSHADGHTDRQMDRERHDKHNSQFCSSANAS
jgi:hypothetical protein